MLTLAFSLGLSDDGDYKGSTLVLDGRVDFGGGGAAERAMVGGTGRFRRARGYSLTTNSLGTGSLDWSGLQPHLYASVGWAGIVTGQRASMFTCDGF
uniref:Dirigent protein n=1 Tax=Oryza barthii TaxID=65489 RepID=A0A0D3FJI4_9ORYZ